MHVHFLEERLNKTQPENAEVTVKHNIDLKVLNQSLEMDLKKHKKLNRDLERVNTALQEQTSDLEEQLDFERREKRAQNEAGSGDNDELLEANANLRETVDILRAQLEDTNNEMVRLRGSLELRSSRASSVASSRIQELEDEIERLANEGNEREREYRSALDALDAQGDELDRERDERRKLELEVERLEWDRDRATHERSESRAEVLEEREEREAVEEVFVDT